MVVLVLVVLAVLFCMLLVKHILLNLQLERIAKDIATRTSENTNRQLKVSVRNPSLVKLMIEINRLYDFIDQQQGEYIDSISVLRQSMQNISHDLRTPLTSIMGYLELMKQPGNTPEQQEQYLEIAVAKTKSLRQLVNALFEYVQLETGEKRFESQKMELNELVAEQLSGLYQAFQQAGIQIKTDLCHTPLEIVADPVQLERVVNNLLNNMLKHSTGDGSISSRVQGKTAVVCFSNKAENLSQKDFDQLFKRFYMSDRTRSGQNTGLGLTIAKQIVEQTGGNIAADWKGQKLTIRVSWPLVVSAV